MAPFGILFAIVFIIPIFYAIYSSFFRQVTEGGGAYGGGELVNKFVGFQNFEYVLTSGNFWSGVGRVLIYTLIQVPLMIIIALALAMVIDSFVVKHIAGFRLATSCRTPFQVWSHPSFGCTCITVRFRRSSKVLRPSE